MLTNELPYEKIIFVCTNRRDPGERISCAYGGGCDLRDALKERVKARGLKPAVRVSASGCMDKCEDGPNIMIFPDNIWLSGVEEEDIEPILDAVVRSLESGRPIESIAPSARPETP
ncbi:MAG: (2Fe-2S) ferredoxin domain-containing protein [Candidatus Hydrogenedentes bacterium]|nr:(2Fe-2S) ferredoxin domain-containing protein [Candidatus Hydrogenedentota bacterium]